MRDVVFILLVIAFFGLAMAYVQACSWVIGPDEQVAPVAGPADLPLAEETAA